MVTLHGVRSKTMLDYLVTIGEAWADRKDRLYRRSVDNVPIQYEETFVFDGAKVSVNYNCLRVDGRNVAVLENNQWFVLDSDETYPFATLEVV